MILRVYGQLLGHLPLLEGAAAAAVVLAVFLRWERQGRRVAVVLAVLGALLLDAAIYASTEATQLPSIFHPYVHGQSFRLTQILTGLGLLARALAPGRPRRGEQAAAWWWAFFAWYLAASVAGLLQGYDRHLVTARAMLLLEAGGMIVLAAGVPVRQWLADRGLPRFLRFAGALAAVMFVLAETHVRITGTALPRLPLLDFGEMGSDAATLFPSLGLLGLAMETTRPRRRPTVLAASAMLVLAHLASPQRAARLGLAVALVAFLLVLCWPRRRRFVARGGDLLVVGMCLAAVVAGPVFARSLSGGPAPSVAASVPFLDLTAQAIDPTYRQGSVESRYNEWAVARPLIAERPVIGWGVGRTFVHYDVGTGTFIDYDLTNNIGLDLLLRSGIVGLLLFAGAVAGTLVAAWRAWTRAGPDAAALLAAMAGAVLVGLLAKGMVESILNEYRLTPLLGLLAGLILALAAGAREEAGPEPGSPREVHRGERGRQPAPGAPVGQRA